MLQIILLAVETEEERNTVIQIFEKYYPSIVAKADSILHNVVDAEDAAMNVIQKIASNPSDFLDYESTDTISKIICMTKNEAIDIYRKNKRRNDMMAYNEEFENNIDEEEDDFLGLIVNQETQMLLVEAIRELEGNYQTAIIMHYSLRMKNSEIAVELGLEYSNVNVILHRARKMLKEIMLAKGYVR